MKRGAPACMLWLHLLLIITVARGEYTLTTSYDELSGGSSVVNRHDSLLNTAVVVKSHTEYTGRQAVFPNLTFSCSGVIHRLLLVGRVGGGSAAPNLTLWQRGEFVLAPQFNYSFPLVDLREVVRNPETGIALFETTVDREHFSGDMFGFSQPNSSSSSVVLQYQRMSGETILTNNLPDNLTIPWDQVFNPGSMFPLVALETSNPECSTVFPSRGALERVVTHHLAIEESLQNAVPDLVQDQLRLFPGMRFTCTATITRLIVGVEISTGGFSKVPEVQVWRLQEGSSDSYSRVDSTPLSVALMQEVALNPGVYHLETSLSFTRDDILGIYYPHKSNVQLPSLAGHGSTVHSSDVDLALPSPTSFQLNSSILDEAVQWPLVAVNSDDLSCVEGFMNQALLKLFLQKRELGHIPTDSKFAFIVPDLQFTSGGLLQKWIFVSREDSIFRNDHPHFQVWRRLDQGFIAVSGTYTFGESPVRSQNLNVYEYTLDPPARVESGDCVGWEQVAASDTRLLPLLVKNTGYDIHMVTNVIVDTILNTEKLTYKSNPLIGVQMLLVTVSSSVPTTAVIIPTVTQSPTPDNGTEDPGGLQQLLGTILGSGLMGIIIILGLVIMFFFIMWAIQRHRKKHGVKVSAADPERTLSNPLYAQEPNGHQYQEVQNNSSKPPPTSVPPAPTIQQQGSVEYAVPNETTRKPPPPLISPKPNKAGRPPLSPLLSGHYHTLERQSPSPLSGSLYHTVESNGHYHTLEPQDASPLLSLPGSSHNSPQFSTAAALQSPLSISSAGPTSSLGRRPRHSPEPSSPFPSLNRLRILHSREPSNASEYDVIQSPSNASEYDVIQPPHNKSATLHSREPSSVSEYDVIDPPCWGTLRSLSSYAGSHSRASSQITTYDDEPHDHVYQELTSQGGYSRLYHRGLYVPTQEQRQRAATSARRQKINIYAALSECSDLPDETEVTFFEESVAYWRPAQDSSGLYAQLAKRKYREIVRSQIKVQHPLGSGNFGEVSKGEWHSEEQGRVEVAIKTLKRGSSEEDTIRFLQEAAIMGQFRHPNIVELLGIITLREPVMMVLELLSLSDLRDYLLTLRPLTPGDALSEDTPHRLLGFCKDIASGMEYLERKLFVHRDLAARNILVSDDHTCKIGDFGMARDLEDESYYISRGGKIPIRWSPPEALNYKKYTTASDVWSFGVVMYEIWSLGHKPYEGYTNPQTQSLVERGERLAPPPGCPRPIYTLMIHCWHPEHSSRPTFLSLLKTLSGSSSELLAWRETEEMDGGAMTLGAPLEAGRYLFTELQNTHINYE